MFITFIADYPLMWFDSLMIDGNISDDNSIELLNKYTAHNRSYHNLHHIASMWQLHKFLIIHEDKTFTLEAEKNLARAVAYHDSVYDGASSLNEFESVRLFRKNEESSAWVDKAILTTRNHFVRRQITTLDDEMLEWFIGLDLASLAAPWQIFSANSMAIRAEYSHLTDDAWIGGRTKFFKRVLNTRPIYQHPIFEKYFEDAAIANIERALSLS